MSPAGQTRSQALIALFLSGVGSIWAVSQVSSGAMEPLTTRLVGPGCRAGGHLHRRFVMLDDSPLVFEETDEMRETRLLSFMSAIHRVSELLYDAFSLSESNEEFSSVMNDRAFAVAAEWGMHQDLVAMLGEEAQHLVYINDYEEDA